MSIQWRDESEIGRTKYTQLTPRKLESLRMLMDWQLRQLGYDPAEINRLTQEMDDRK